MVTEGFLKKFENRCIEVLKQYFQADTLEQLPNVGE